MCICVHVLAGSYVSGDCACNSGYTGSNGSTCTACEVGKYKDAPGAASCTACPGDTTSPAGAICAGTKGSLLFFGADAVGCACVHGGWMLVVKAVSTCWLGSVCLAH